MSFVLKLGSCGFRLVIAALGLGCATAALAAEEAAETSSPEAEQNNAENTKAQKMKQNDGENPLNWLYHSRLGLGAGHSSVAKQMKSDRLGFGLFAGRTLKEFNLPLVNGKDVTAGAAYQTFSGVDVSEDTQWSVQSIGPQLRLIMSPFLSGLELSVLGGLSVQRFVSEKGPRRLESSSYGAAISSGAFARWPLPALERMHVVAGADLLLGSATWFSVGGGLEAEF